MNLLWIVRLPAVAICLVIVSSTSAAVFYWDGDTDNTYSDASNWSSTRPANTNPGVAPGAGDVITWARDAAVNKSVFLSTPQSAGAWVTDTGAATYPYMSGGTGASITLTGATIDLTSFSGGSFGSTANVIYAGTRGATFANTAPVTVSGGGTKTVYQSNSPGFEFKLEGSLGETGGAASLTKLGFGRMIVQGNYLLTGNIIVSQGDLRLERGFDVSSFGSTLTITDSTTGNNKRFFLNNGQTYTFAGATVRGTALAPGDYTHQQLVNLGMNSSFYGVSTTVANNTGILRIVAAVPEPMAPLLGLVAIGFASFVHRRTRVTRSF